MVLCINSTGEKAIKEQKKRTIIDYEKGLLVGQKGDGGRKEAILYLLRLNGLLGPFIFTIVNIKIRPLSDRASYTTQAHALLLHF